jgi:hypothetical protein
MGEKGKERGRSGCCMTTPGCCLMTPGCCLTTPGCGGDGAELRLIRQRCRYVAKLRGDVAAAERLEMPDGPAGGMRGA